VTSNFPIRSIWLCLALITFALLQSGCKPIRAPEAIPDVLPTEATVDAARADLSTNTRNEWSSPDGEWIATTLFQIPRDGGEYYQSLIVAHASGAPSYTLVEGWFTLVPGYKVTEPLHWSQDGKRFYYTNRHQPDGCGLLYNGSDLHQLELASGETKELLPADTTIKIGLAPDETHVAYQAIGEPVLLIHDLSSDEINSFDLVSYLDSDQMGAIVWSSDSSALAFVIAHNPCSGGWAESTSIYTLDAASLTLTAHLEHDGRLLVPVAWPSAQTLLLENREGEQFTLDLPTNSVTP
jgi:hypothetical protein